MKELELPASKSTTVVKPVKTRVVRSRTVSKSPMKEKGPLRKRSLKRLAEVLEIMAAPRVTTRSAKKTEMEKAQSSGVQSLQSRVASRTITPKKEIL